MPGKMPEAITGTEQYFDDNELIVSKTNLKGQLIYCNDVFLSIAGYSEKECLGQPHSMIRHPNMPRCIFNLLWDTILDGKEIFAYVINRCKNGDYYWVQAHVTPSRNEAGTIVGYHSTRRTPDREILDEKIKPLYESLLAEENQHSNRKTGMQAGKKMLENMLATQNLEYDEFIATL